ncbi:guanylate-binding protein 6-like isoform X1 [Phacochoerus africanus]|uniref:guanylate-binding protein 6-like isoform X1 n=1 Tax=Phacochoerus africanus TaxID=41426 RepID=UPI001FDA9C4E|nr:guanylate-binding protein 6-like isoform X1 [Phacochoerus africanus]
MASGPNMTDPICLIKNNNELLSVNQEALEILEKISQPVVVVAIVGLYRTGKSYLMNRLAGRNHGFRLGSTVQSETKGIWMWCVPHPSKPDRTLVLLDTEGLGDVEKGDPKNDSWIFALAVLLSSVFVYNSMNTINHQALEQLHYVTELTELIRTKSSSENDGVEDCTEFVSFFPDFIWIVRDFTLDLKLNGHPVTEDEYLENALKLIPGNNPKARISNLPRECIRNFFPKRKCFVFDRPTHDKDLLANIENVSDDQLDPKFQEQANNFCSYIFTNAKTKTLSDGITVIGKRLGTLVVAYVDAINTGDVPCLENAVTTLAQLENSVAMQKAADLYSEQMAQRLSLPTDTLLELLEVHADCESKAIALFMEQSFKDDTQEFQKMLVEIIKNKKEGFVLQNEEASAKYCQEKLDQLSKTLMQGISAGMFSVPGGHELYRRAKTKLEMEYCQVPRKGIKADKVLQRFLQSQVAIEKSILQADKALTDGQKAIAEERARKEAAEKAQELLNQELQEQEQHLAAQQRSFQENIAQLTEKLEKERANILREQDKMLEHKLKVQEALLKEGFKKKSQEMNAEIQHLRNMIARNQDTETSWITTALHAFGREMASVLFSPSKLLDYIVKGVSSLYKK